MESRSPTVLWQQIRKWLCRQEGQDLIEYGLLLALIVVLCIAAVALMGTKISSVWASAVGAL